MNDRSNQRKNEAEKLHRELKQLEAEIAKAKGQAQAMEVRKKRRGAAQHGRARQILLP